MEVASSVQFSADKFPEVVKQWKHNAHTIKEAVKAATDVPKVLPLLDTTFTRVSIITSMIQSFVNALSIFTEASGLKLEMTVVKKLESLFHKLIKDILKLNPRIKKVLHHIAEMITTGLNLISQVLDKLVVFREFHKDFDGVVEPELRQFGEQSRPILDFVEKFVPKLFQTLTSKLNWVNMQLHDSPFNKVKKGVKLYWKVSTMLKEFVEHTTFMEVIYKNKFKLPLPPQSCVDTFKGKRKQGVKTSGDFATEMAKLYERHVAVETALGRRRRWKKLGKKVKKTVKKVVKKVKNAGSCLKLKMRSFSVLDLFRFFSGAWKNLIKGPANIASKVTGPIKKFLKSLLQKLGLGRNKNSIIITKLKTAMPKEAFQHISVERLKGILNLAEEIGAKTCGVMQTAVKKVHKVLQIIWSLDSIIHSLPIPKKVKTEMLSLRDSLKNLGLLKKTHIGTCQLPKNPTIDSSLIPSDTLKMLVKQQVHRKAEEQKRREEEANRTVLRKKREDARKAADNAYGRNAYDHYYEDTDGLYTDGAQSYGRR